MVVLIEGVDYNIGNGTGAPVAEAIATHTHKGDNVNFFCSLQAECCRRLLRKKRRNKWESTLTKRNYPPIHMDPTYTTQGGECIRFMTRKGLEKCQKFLVNGLFYHYVDGKPELYSSSDVVLDGVTGDMIVMDHKGNLFVHPKIRGKLHHSSFFSQKPIAFGAMIRIKNGRIVKSDGSTDDLTDIVLSPKREEGLDCPSGLLYYSGHYDAPESVKQRALDLFKKLLMLKHGYLRSLGVEYGDHPSIPKGTTSVFHHHDPDINLNCKGKYVYLVHKYTYSPKKALTAVSVDIQGHADHSRPDLAKGAGGKFRYLSFENDESSETIIPEVWLWRTPLQFFYPSSKGYQFTIDLNAGRKRDYVYLCWERADRYTVPSRIN